MIRVLIVDDEYIMRQGLKYMIDWEREGYEIVGEAANGKAALDLIEQTDPHIVISDIVMPMLDGLDFTEVVHRLYPRLQIIILSGYDNFEYVKKTFQNGVADYILKPTLNEEELLKVLEKASERLPHYQTERAGLKKSSSPERLLERYLLGMDAQLKQGAESKLFMKGYLRFFALNIRKENRQGDSLSDVMYNKIERFFSSQAEYESIICMLREEIVCVLICYEHDKEGALLDELTGLANQLRLICEDSFCVCSSPLHISEIKKLRQLYLDEIAANTEKSFYYENESMLLIEKGEEKSDEEIDKFDFFRYNQLLWGSRYKDAADMLLKYSDRALSGQMDSYRLKNQIENMIYHYMDSLSIGDDEKDSFRKEFFVRIKDVRYEREYRKCIDDITAELIRMSQDEYLQDDNRITKMLDYIFENYREDLKLEDLADEFNFNYHYISTYFNKHMNEGFSDYLNRIRIENACKMLLTSDMSIASVSSEVGYSEHSYFCRVFKRIVGETPSAWRRKQHEK